MGLPYFPPPVVWKVGRVPSETAKAPDSRCAVWRHPCHDATVGVLTVPLKGCGHSPRSECTRCSLTDSHSLTVMAGRGLSHILGGRKHKVLYVHVIKLPPSFDAQYLLNSDLRKRRSRVPTLYSTQPHSENSHPSPIPSHDSFPRRP